MESKIVFFVAHLGCANHDEHLWAVGMIIFPIRNGPGSKVWVDHVVEAKIWHVFMAEKRPLKKKIYSPVLIHIVNGVVASLKSILIKILLMEEILHHLGWLKPYR